MSRDDLFFLAGMGMILLSPLLCVGIAWVAYPYMDMKKMERKDLMEVVFLTVGFFCYVILAWGQLTQWTFVLN